MRIACGSMNGRLWWSVDDALLSHSRYVFGYAVRRVEPFIYDASVGWTRSYFYIWSIWTFAGRKWCSSTHKVVTDYIISMVCLWVCSIGWIAIALTYDSRITDFNAVRVEFCDYTLMGLQSSLDWIILLIYIFFFGVNRTCVSWFAGDVVTLKIFALMNY